MVLRLMQRHKAVRFFGYCLHILHGLS
jgi:hypothetical protein